MNIDEIAARLGAANRDGLALVLLRLDRDLAGGANIGDGHPRFDIHVALAEVTLDMGVATAEEMDEAIVADAAGPAVEWNAIAKQTITRIATRMALSPIAIRLGIH